MEAHVTRNDDGSVTVIQDVPIPDPEGETVLRTVVNISVSGSVEVISDVVVLN